MRKEYVKLSPAEDMYFSFLRAGELFSLNPAFTGNVNQDWELWLTYYKKLST